MSVFVGLDCGGSSTRVLAIDEAGLRLFRGQAGPANLLSTPEATLARSLQKATEGCPPPDSVCGCFAGLVDASVHALALAHLRQIFPGTVRLRAEPDYAAALAACGPEATACVIAGTGSIVCSMVEGALVKSGGRGPLLGDVGSASQIGRRALSLYLDDPSAFSRRFTNEIQRLFGETEERPVVRRLYTADSPAALLAKLAGPTAEEAQDHLGLRQIIAEEMSSLAALVARHFRKCRLPTGKIGLAGGLWKTSALFWSEFHHSLHDLINLDAFLLKRPPVEGAAALAQEALVVH